MLCCAVLCCVVLCCVVLCCAVLCCVVLCCVVLCCVVLCCVVLCCVVLCCVVLCYVVCKLHLLSACILIPVYSLQSAFHTDQSGNAKRWRCVTQWRLWQEMNSVANTKWSKVTHLSYLAIVDPRIIVVFLSPLDGFKYPVYAIAAFP